MSYFTPATDPKLYACSCARPECDARPVDDRLVMTLELIRHYVGRPVAVTSGPRCVYWNQREGGAVPSAHLTGEAADLACATSRDRWDLIAAAQQAGVRRIGVGATFVHVDVSRDLPQFRMWSYYPKAVAG